MNVLDLALLAGSAALAVPALVFVTQCLMGLLQGDCRLPLAARRPRAAVLVPAHDEEGVIDVNLPALLAELGPEDRLLVVADNCSDRTAAVARALGAEVTERQDAERRGKGFALAHGMATLAASGQPPEVLIVVDADTRVAPGSFEALARHALATGGPVQSDWELGPPDDASPRGALSTLAYLVRNRMRTRGMACLGLPIQLQGSGMAIPWELARTSQFGGSAIVEDVVIGIELALRGHAPRPCQHSRVFARMPAAEAVARTQRRRWEHGHLQTMGRHGPRLLLAGLRRLQPGLVAMALDLLVPPLSLLVLLLLLHTAVCAGLWGVGLAGGLPAAAAAAVLGAVGFAVWTSWMRVGRGVVPPGALARAPLYLAWKLPLYLAFLARRSEQRWVRTAREARDMAGCSPQGS